MNNKTTPWNKIKTEYLEGATPKELGLKYRIKPKAISDRFSGMGIVEEKRIISKEIKTSVEDELKEISSLCTKWLKDLLRDKKLKPNEKIAAIKVGLELTILNKNKENQDSITHPLNKLAEVLENDIKYYQQVGALTKENSTD